MAGTGSSSIEYQQKVIPTTFYSCQKFLINIEKSNFLSKAKFIAASSHRTLGIQKKVYSWAELGEVWYQVRAPRANTATSSTRAGPAAEFIYINLAFLFQSNIFILHSWLTKGKSLRPKVAALGIKTGLNQNGNMSAYK